MKQEKSPNGRRVLIVDADRREGTTTATALRAQGYDAAATTNPFQALERARAFDPDVVVTDLRLPALGGLELMHRIREEWPHTAVVVVAANPSIQATQLSRESEVPRL